MSEVETEIQADNAPVEQERPAWLPSNFDKPEDLAKSYTHAASKITEQGQELAALRSQIEEIQAYQTQAQSQQYGNDIEQQLYDAYESGDGRSIAAANAFLIKQAVEQQAAALQQPAPVQQISADMVADYADRTITAEYPDWPEYRAKVGEVIAANPALSKALEGETNPAVLVGHLKTAYKLAKFDSGQTASASAAETLDELNRANKNAAQTMSGTNASTEAESYWDTVKAAKSGVPRFSL